MFEPVSLHVYQHKAMMSCDQYQLWNFSASISFDLMLYNLTDIYRKIFEECNRVDRYLNRMSFVNMSFIRMQEKISFTNYRLGMGQSIGAQRF